MATHGTRGGGGNSSAIAAMTMAASHHGADTDAAGWGSLAGSLRGPPRLSQRRCVISARLAGSGCQRSSQAGAFVLRLGRHQRRRAAPAAPVQIRSRSEPARAPSPPGSTPPHVVHPHADGAAGAVQGQPERWLAVALRRPTVAYVVAGMLTGPVWWFYLFWVPGFLNDKYGLNTRLHGVTTA